MAGGARITLMKNAEYRPSKKNPPAVHFCFLAYWEQWPCIYLVILSQTDNETMQDEWVDATKNELPIDRQIY